MKLIITGALGFIGSNFVRHMLNKYPDYHIVNLDSVTYAANFNNLKDFEGNPNYEFVRGDICDEELVDVLVCGADAVINFAAESHVDRSILAADEFIRTNVVGTHVLLKACLKHNVRLHHVSTDEVFGSLSLESTDKFNENTNYDPSSPYSASKASSDHLVRAYFKTHGLKVTISNCSNNYGPYQNPEKLIPKAIVKALSNEKIPIYGNGRNVRDWVHVLDHCEAIDLILHKGTIGETYLVGGNCEKSNLDIVNSILELTGRDDSLLEFVADRIGHDLRYSVDSSKIERELGWVRKYDFNVGLWETVNWYAENPNWWTRLI